MREKECVIRHLLEDDRNYTTVQWYSERGVPKWKEHGNRPILTTEIGNIVYILADFGNRNTGGHGYFEIIGKDIRNHTPGNLIPFQ